MSKAVTVSPAVGMLFLSSVYGKSWRIACLNLNGTSIYEMLRLMDQIDRKDLAEIVQTAAGMGWAINVPRLLFAAGVIADRRVSGAVPDDCKGELPIVQAFLAKASPLQIPRDPTASLPAPSPGQGPLGADDYKNGAALIGVSAAVVHAVADVESGGRTGFSADGRPIVRYELHIFGNRTKSVYTKTHPHLSNSYEGGKKHHDGGQPNEWSMIYGAMLLRGCREDALSSASWGMFQVMGFNYRAAGYTSVGDFVADMCVSPAQHLKAFLNICKNNRWDRFLAAKDWAGFASHYNGSKYKENHYDTNLEAAYRRHGGS